jgi:hypothetical protein
MTAFNRNSNGTTSLGKVAIAAFFLTSSTSPISQESPANKKNMGDIYQFSREWEKKLFDHPGYGAINSNFIKFKPRTDFGKKLMEIRTKIVSSRVPLLDWDQVSAEVKSRRGEIES